MPPCQGVAQCLACAHDLHPHPPRGRCCVLPNSTTRQYHQYHTTVRRRIGSTRLNASCCPSVEAFCTTWAHEQVHSAGHSSRLNRGFSERPWSADDRPHRQDVREELLAELATFLFCHWLGINHTARNHGTYTGYWVCAALLGRVSKEGPKALFLGSGPGIGRGRCDLRS